MASGASLWSAGPATSQFIRRLLYLGEAMMAGAILFILIAVGIIVRRIVTSGYVTTTDFLLFGVIGVVFLSIGLRNVWAVRTAGREGRQSWVYEEWMETRRWMWVLTGAILVTAMLFGLSVLLLTWGSGGWALQGVNLLMFGTLLSGLSLRMIVRWKVESNAQPAE